MNKSESAGKLIMNDPPADSSSDLQCYGWLHTLLTIVSRLTMNDPLALTLPWWQSTITLTPPCLSGCFTSHFLSLLLNYHMLAWPSELFLYHSDLQMLTVSFHICWKYFWIIQGTIKKYSPHFCSLRLVSPVFRIGFLTCLPAFPFRHSPDCGSSVDPQL